MSLRRLQLARLRHRDRATLVFLDGLLTHIERRRRRGWSGLGYNRAILNCGRRMIIACGARAEHSLFWGNDGRGVNRDRSGDGFVLIHRDQVTSHRLSGSEGVRRGSGHRAGNTLVYIPNVIYGDVLVDDGGVVIIVDHGLVDGGVRDVDVVDVRAADRIRRHVHFTRSEREPANIHAGRKTTAESDASSEVRAADPSD